jgi:uncharacterized membrane protein
MMDRVSFLTIGGMALTTYLTRVGGYLLLGNRRFSARATAFMDIVPGCVLISVIAPTFAAGRVPDLVGLALTILAASRLSLLPTIAIGVGSTGLLRLVFPV